jgi:Na+/H+ antiporter NhaA
VQRRWSLARRARAVVLDPLREFLRAESAGGVALLAAVVLALAWANSPASGA